MRGKDIEQPFLDLLNGITPAYAGKRAVRLNPLHIVSGSPPPMRGKASGGSLTCG